MNQGEHLFEVSSVGLLVLVNQDITKEGSIGQRHNVEY